MVHSDVGAFSRALLPRYRLRDYQLDPARAIIRAVRGCTGEGFAVVFSRQSGKDEMLAQTIAYLLALYRRRGGSIVVVSPTLRPQGMISRSRLLGRLDNSLTRSLVTTEGGTVRVGRARCSFASAAPGSNARGETASLLLVCNEAQDVPPDRWDAVFDPMAASTNAPTVFLGTVWTSRTLLARQMSYYQELEKTDGSRRVFRVPWERVAADVPAYGERVRGRIRQLGRAHPFVKTEYFLEELNGEGGLFPPAVKERMRGSHPRQRGFVDGNLHATIESGSAAIEVGHAATGGNRVYAMLVDVGGEERSKTSTMPAYTGGGQVDGEPDARRDSTALTVVEVDTSTLNDPSLLALTYRVVDRRTWTGTGQPELLRELLHLARMVWLPRRVVVDATGVGAGLASFLERALGPNAVVPFVFSTASKSDLGWEFLSLCSAGRFLDHAPDGSPEQALFWAQVEECEYETLPGPGRRMRWGVNGSTHDDLLISAAMCAVLDRCDWRERVARGRERE